MMTTNEVARIYDTILSTPGMNEMVRIDMKISRKNILLLHGVIQRGLGAKEDDRLTALLESISEEALAELHGIANDYLTKAGLKELSEKLNVLGKK